ncbi:MAG TPA: FAD-dependent oxidoreductase, partial [Arthrobacter sp.]|nr:FAD-dependent oxidoreductase [Arthrobacter sp.]
ADLKRRKVQLHASSPVKTIAKHDGGWRVASADKMFDADGLVVAADGASAVTLLQESIPGLAELKPAPGPSVALVTLVVDQPELDAKPRGTGLLVAPGVEGIKAKALTHATAKWPWLAAETGPGSHVLRLSYGRAVGQAGAAAAEDFTGWPDERLYRQALSDATALMGTPVTDPDVLGWKVVRWVGALPSATVGHRDRVAQVRELAAGGSNLQLTGAWLAGTGLVAVVADSRTRARQLAAELKAAAPSSP